MPLYSLATSYVARIARPTRYHSFTPFFLPSLLTSLALRKIERTGAQMTLVTALSEAGGNNPVSQATLTYLRPGDVIQLVVVKVSIALRLNTFS